MNLDPKNAEHKAKNIAEMLCIKFAEIDESPRIVLIGMAIAASTLMKTLKDSKNVDLLPDFIGDLKKCANQMSNMPEKPLTEWQQKLKLEEELREAESAVRGALNEAERARAKLHDFLEKKAFPDPPKPIRSCNRHQNCNEADEAFRKSEGRDPGVNYHCHSEDCEDCYGK